MQYCPLYKLIHWADLWPHSTWFVHICVCISVCVRLLKWETFSHLPSSLAPRHVIAAPSEKVHVVVTEGFSGKGVYMWHGATVCRLPAAARRRTTRLTMARRFLCVYSDLYSPSLLAPVWEETLPLMWIYTSVNLTKRERDSREEGKGSTHTKKEGKAQGSIHRGEKEQQLTKETRQWRKESKTATF